MAIYGFGEFSLDTRSGELRRGGYRVRLRPQPAALLEYFLQHAGEVVTREDLRRVLWPDGTFVHFDHGLNSCVKQLRAALLDRRVAPRYLETLPRRGYRFIGPVVKTDAGATEAYPTVRSDADSWVSVVSGTVRIENGRARVSLTLVDPGTNVQVWSTEFDCDADDVRGMQARMAAEVIEGISRTARGEPSGTVATTGPPDALMM